MGLLKAIVNRFRSTTNVITETMTNSYEDGKLAVEDSKKQLDKFVVDIATFTANNNKIKQERDKQLLKANEYSVIAKQAVDVDNLEDAKEALELKQSAEATVGTLEAELERNAKVLERLRNDLSTNKRKIREAERKLEMLKARESGVQIRKKMVETNSGLLSQRNGLASLDVFDDEVNTEELTVDALEELTDEDNAPLTEKYNTSDADIQTELDKLIIAKQKRDKTKKK